MSESTAFDAYNKFMALKQHFSSSSYDFFKYHGKVRSNINTFRTKKDRFFFEKISRKYQGQELINFYVSNLIKNRDIWIGELTRDAECDRTYISWKKRIQSLTYNFQCDTILLHEKCETFNDLFSCEEPYNEYPKLFDVYQEGDIQLESIIGIDFVLGCFGSWNRNYKGDIIWDDFYHLCRSYTPFLNYDVETKMKFKKLLQKEFV